jgi:hypothetical protein
MDLKKYKINFMPFYVEIYFTQKLLMQLLCIKTFFAIQVHNEVNVKKNLYL